MAKVERNGYTSRVEIYREEGYAIKWVKGGELRKCLQWEVDALTKIKAVDSKHFPVVMEIFKDHFKMTYCGEPPTKTTVPENFEEQIIEIISVLKKADVLNRDIRPGNILIHDDTIKICDFGWATTLIKPKPRPTMAPGLGADYRLGLDKFNDEHSLRKSITDIRSGAWPKPPKLIKKK